MTFDEYGVVARAAWLAAVAAERERAAKVVEATATCDCENSLRQFCECYGYATLRRLAARIREGGNG